jgi:hypothetical protein
VRSAEREPLVSDGTTVKVIKPVIVARKIDPAKRRDAGESPRTFAASKIERAIERIP